MLSKVLEDKILFSSMNVIGDISLRFFNDQGQYVSRELNDRIKWMKLGL